MKHAFELWNCLCNNWIYNGNNSSQHFFPSVSMCSWSSMWKHMSEVSSFFMQEFQGTQQHVVFSVYTRTVFLTLPWQVHTSVHTLCTCERNPPLGIESSFFFSYANTIFFFHQKWKGKECCQCCPAELPGRFPHFLQLQRPPRVSHTGSCNNTAAWWVHGQNTDHLKAAGMNSQR